MSTLLIPAAGKSSRFPNMRPKWLLTHPTGKIMLDMVLNSANYLDFERTVVTILRDHCIRYDADVILRQVFGDSIEIVILDNPTSSAAETVYETIKLAKISGNIVIKDSDCIVEYTATEAKDFIVGLTINSSSSVEKIQTKSFIIKNDDDIILDVVEKEIVSNIICLGVYSLDCEDFNRSYESIVDSDVYKLNGEIYVSHVISYLILSGDVIFGHVEADRFIDWGTKNDWYEELRKHNTYIFDIDGVLLTNYGKYGAKNHSNTFEPIERNIAELKRLSDAGHQIIFMTARSNEVLQEFKDFLREREIRYKTIISDCYHGKRIIVNDFAPTNPHPSCDAISIKRNDFLESYL
jgi:hypothetical protein